MATRHILYLTNERLVSLVARGGRIVERKVFPVTGAGHTDFEQYMKGLRRVPTNLITDLAEEDFRLDTIPHLGARDREAVFGRKLNQIFRNTPYKHAIAQGREPDGRRDDRVVYTAITNGEVLRPWVEVLERLKVPVDGIHSSAVFSGRLLGDLNLSFPHALLVTFTPGDAVRQTYFRDKEIKFSRLTPIDLEEGETLGGLLAGETARTFQYLDSLRNFVPADRLEVCVLIHPKDRPAVEPALRDYDQIEYRLLDIEQVAAKIGLKPPPASSSAEEVLAHLFLRRKSENHFAPPELRRFGVLRSARNSIFVTAGVILAAGLAYGGWNLNSVLQSHEQDMQTLRRVEALDREHAEIIRSMPLQEVGGQTMRDTVAFYSGSLRAYPTVSSFLYPISSVLDRYPGIRLTQVAWEAADDDKAMPAFAPTIPRNPPPFKSVAKGSEVAVTGVQGRQADAGEGPFSRGRFAVAILEGTVKVAGFGIRESLSQVESFVADIGKIEGYRASLIDSPLDITTRVGIQGRFTDRELGATDVRFSVKVSRATESRT